jgi:hypothetical protein
VGDGGSTDANHISGYWNAIPDAGTRLFTSENAGVTGADITSIWKGVAGTNENDAVK